MPGQGAKSAGFSEPSLFALFGLNTPFSKKLNKLNNQYPNGKRLHHKKRIERNNLLYPASIPEQEMRRKACTNDTQRLFFTIRAKHFICHGGPA